MAYAQVIFATVWGALFFSEHPGMWAVIGGLGIVLGNWIIQRGPRPSPGSGARS
jgi:drug/metabolite transporter (DMT)-like permease